MQLNHIRIKLNKKKTKINFTKKKYVYIQKTKKIKECRIRTKQSPELHKLWVITTGFNLKCHHQVIQQKIPNNLFFFKLV